MAAHLMGDADAIATLAQAGRAALRMGAVRAARRHLEAGVALAGTSVSPELLLDLGAALMADGAGEAAVAVYKRLLQHPLLSEGSRVTALRQLGRVAFSNAQVERAARWFEAAIDLVARDHPDLAIGALLDQAIQTWALRGPRAAMPLAAQARTLAGKVGRPLRACAEATWALCAYLCGDPRGLEAAEAAATSAEIIDSSLLGDIHWGLDPACVPGDVAVWAERFTIADRLFTKILAATAQRSEPFLIFHALFSWADGLRRLGRLEGSLALSERAIEAADVVPVAVPLVNAGKALTLLEMGRLHEAAVLSDRVAAAVRDGYPWYLVIGYDLRLRGMLALRQDAVETACQTFAQLEDLAEGWGLLDPSHIPWADDAITAYLLCNRNADARRVVERLEVQAVALPSRWPKAVAAAGRAALAEREGAVALAEACFSQALALQDGMEMPLARARTLTEYGAFLSRRGEPDRARSVLAEAIRTADACGVAWHANQARVQWRRAGGRARRRGPGTLSPQEAAVARLARAGKTNREIARQLFLSVNTVETHLAHVYGKLGIHRRWELIARTDLDLGVDSGG
jgi:DNA-binding CsgD family transcriptional regulator